LGNISNSLEGIASTNLRLGINFDPLEQSRLAKDLSSFSLNSYTKLSPIAWNSDSDYLTYFMDLGLRTNNLARSRSKYKIGLILEPKDWAPGIAKLAQKSKENLDLILTYEPSLLDLGFPFHPYIPGGILLQPNYKLTEPEKSKLISISASRKKKLSGHRLRHSIAAALGHYSRFTILGNGYAPYGDPMTPYNDFMFSIVIENSKAPYNITEKLLQCLLGFTVPIYWGGDLEKLGFDLDGIIQVETAEEIIDVAHSVTEANYWSRQDSINRNFMAAQRYCSKEVNILRATRDGLPELGIPDVQAPKFELGFEIEPKRLVIPQTVRENFRSRLSRFAAYQLGL
jgi:hypothetical protein